MSIRIASRFLAVSTRVSPFCTALPDAATFTVSAESRLRVPGSQAKAWARPCAALKGTSRPLHQVHLVLSVELFDEHVHALAAVHLHLLAHDVGLDRQLAAAAVHQHAQRDALGAPEVGELVERGAHGAAGVEHVVHDDDVFAREVAWDAGLPDHGLGAHGLEVVAVPGDSEGPGGA